MTYPKYDTCDSPKKHFDLFKQHFSLKAFKNCSHMVNMFNPGLVIKPNVVKEDQDKLTQISSKKLKVPD